MDHDSIGVGIQVLNCLTMNFSELSHGPAGIARAHQHLKKKKQNKTKHTHTHKHKLAETCFFETFPQSNKLASLFVLVFKKNIHVVE